MQLRHLKTIHPPSDMIDGRFQKVTAIAWSPNHYRLAVATTDRYITLYDDTGLQRDKFPTKPADKDVPAAKNYSIRGMEFSQDSTKLAVAQSDNIIFIYKLGATWNDKKTICNKYPQSSSVTCLAWPSQRIGEIVFGCADGKVKVGNASNKTISLYSTESYVVAVTPSPDGSSFLSAHLDGTVIKYVFPSDTRAAVQTMLIQTSFTPYALAWGQHIVVAGNSGQVKVIDPSGTAVQSLDFSNDDRLKEFSCSAMNPSGHTLVLGSFSRFVVLVYNAHKNVWEEAGQVAVDNLYSITAMRWKGDGSRLVTGSLCGVVDIYDACLKRLNIKGDFEITYTSHSSVVVFRKSQPSIRMSLKSRYNCEIQKINVMQDRYVVVHTTNTILIGDITTGKMSEIERVQQTGNVKEKFIFDNDQVCMVYQGGELCIVEYGSNDILGSCRTEHMSSHLLSVRINEARNSKEQPVKTIAFLLDAQAIQVKDLERQSTVATINHDCKIDWLELNQRATKLLFRDKRRALHLYDFESQTRSTLLSFCNYVQWVPDSDVVVAQSRRTLCVWYSIDNPADVTNIAIRGDVEQIERAGGRTTVLIDEGITKTPISLDEGLIAFGAAIDAHDFKKAVSILENLKDKQEKDGQQMSAGAEAMWTQLSRLALEETDFIIAERCFSALGDVSKTKYLNKINAILAANENNKNHYLITAHLAMLNKQFKRAEHILLTQGAVDEAINMYRQLHKWEEALAVAESKNSSQLKSLRAQYYQYLLNTKQEEIAGELKERSGEYDEALQLYLKGGFPIRAANLVTQQGLTHDQALCERVATALLSSRNYEKAGEFFEGQRSYKRALEAYVKGHAFARAVELSRREFPSQVVRLEEEWGDYLVGQKQMDAASNHYIQAGASLKAINAAIEARQWTKAVQIIDTIDSAQAKPYYKKIAQNFAEQKKYSDAEKYFIAGGLPQEAVQMYTQANLYDKAHSIAVTYMPEAQVGLLYVTQAQKLESNNKLKEAEKLYCTVNEYDLAINMYKKNRQYDDMIRLVSQYRKELLTETHLQLAAQFASEGNYKQAEANYIKGKDWKPAVQMYREADMWEDVLRVAKAHGGVQAYKQWAYNFAVSVGGDAGVKLLIKKGLGELAVDYAIERGEFTEAFHIAEKSCKQKLPEVHLQYAMALEDEGRFEKAEVEFIKAKKPKEAIDMYLHQQAWENALRVAEQHEPTAIPDILDAQGKHAIEDKNYVVAESLFLNAKKPDLAIKMYQDLGQFDDAIRLARVHNPRLVASIQNDRNHHVTQTAPSDSSDYLVSQAKMLVHQKSYSAAIDAYLKFSKEHTNDASQLEKHWESAVALAMEHVPSRISEVVNLVGRRLNEIGRYDAAADLYAGIEDWKSAIDTYIQGKKFDKARQLAQAEAPQLINYVEKAYQAELIRKDDLSGLNDVNPEAAIDVHVSRNEWNKVYELAGKQGEAVVAKYAAMHAAILVQDAKYKQALTVLVKHGLHVVPAHFPVYKRIAHEILRVIPDANERRQLTQWEQETYSELREMLSKLVHELHDIDPHSPATQEFERLFLISHYCALRLTTERMDMKGLTAKIATSLLRYTTDIPADKAFYDAGHACRDVNILNMAFVFLNRYVDITDVIADPESGDIDNSDFMETDIPNPVKVSIPAKSWYVDEIREEAREWVLDKAMSHDIEQTLSTRICEKCSKETFEAALECHSCHNQSQPCIVTGYPILRNKKIACKSCKQVANKDDWNKYVTKMKTCPWCGTLSTPEF